MESETPTTSIQPKTKIMTTTNEKSKTSPLIQSTGSTCCFLEGRKCPKCEATPITGSKLVWCSNVDCNWGVDGTDIRYDDFILENVEVDDE